MGQFNLSTAEKSVNYLNDCSRHDLRAGFGLSKFPLNRNTNDCKFGHQGLFEIKFAEIDFTLRRFQRSEAFDIVAEVNILHRLEFFFGLLLSHRK